jgi:hypothetical protein
MKTDSTCAYFRGDNNPETEMDVAKRMDDFASDHLLPILPVLFVDCAIRCL